MYFFRSDLFSVSYFVFHYCCVNSDSRILADSPMIVNIIEIKIMDSYYYLLVIFMAGRPNSGYQPGLQELELARVESRSQMNPPLIEER